MAWYTIAKNLKSVDRDRITAIMRRAPVVVIFLLISLLSVTLHPSQAAHPDPNQNHRSVFPPYPEEPVVAKVFFTGPDDLNRLARELDIWEVDHAASFLVAMLTPGEYQSLRAAGYQIEIDLEKTGSLQEENEYLPGQVSGIPGFPCYRTVEETYADLAQIALDHPDLAEWIDIGDSWEKTIPGGPSGYDIYALALTNEGAPGIKPTFYLMAAIHAREYATAELATRFAEYLVDNYGVDPDITWLLDHYQVHITPHANPDGRKIAEGGALWRKNTDDDDGCFLSSLAGVDLNRNSSFKWGGLGASTSPCDQTYRGPSAASEPETAAVEAHLRSIFPDQRGDADGDPAPADASGVFITLHSYGEWVLFPWGWTGTAAPNNTALETLGRKFGYFNGYLVCQSGEPGCIYATSGTTDDFAYGDLGVAAYTFELGNEFFESCSIFEATILPNHLPALIYALKAARQPYLDPAGPDILNPSLSGDSVPAGSPVDLSATADDTRYDDNGWAGEEPVQDITAARFSVDAPSWAGGTTLFPLSPADGSYDSPVEDLQGTIDTSGWMPGLHTIFIESQDAEGNWGVPSAVFLTITDSGYQPGLEPANQAGEALRGTPLAYTLTLTNLSALEDSFTLQVAGNAWQVSAPPGPIGPLAPGASEEITVTVDIPGTALDGEQDTATLTAASQGDPGRTAIAVLITTARQPAAFFPLVQK
jgi:hypothetical protein